MHEKDTKKVCDNSCTTCRHEDREYDESPCVDCVRGDGDDEMWEAKPKNPLDGFECCIMDSGAWEDFKNGKFAVILRNRKDYNDFMNRCEKRGIGWVSGASPKSFLPDPMWLDKPEPVAVGRFGNDYGKIAYSSCIESWLADTDYKYYIYSGDQDSKTDKPEQPQIKDSGSRREFESGAVRDICEGKGRCDLLPLDVIGSVMNDTIIVGIADFVFTHDTFCLIEVVRDFTEMVWGKDADMVLDLAKHFEEGAKKYGERNWEKGIPVHCYIDSAVRHYLKWLRGDKDEPHDRAFVFNLVGCIWTMKHRPDLDDLPKKEEPNEPVSG